MERGKPMAVYAKKQKKMEWELPPAGVPVNARLVEVEDLGERDGKYGRSPWVKFRWETALMGKNGLPIEVWEQFPNTLSEKGRLAARIFSITGEMPDPNDEHYDLSKLVGAEAVIVLKYNVKEDGTTYANIVNLIREPSKKEAAAEARVQRVIDASKKKQTKTGLSSRPATA
jgi:hypothetical protein